jgi:putative colanic acid biosynthesis acetyltransferase WcaF
MTSTILPKPPTHRDRLCTLSQESSYSSPWSLKTRVLLALWSLVYLFLFRWTPKPLFRWRAGLLRLFGAKIEGTPFVASSSHIKMPWNLTLAHRACIGANVQVYNLGPVIVGARATVAQEVYLCTGTHDFENPILPLMVGSIEIGEDAFIGARAFINPGVSVGEGAIVGACSVVTRDVAAWTVSAGNPSRVFRNRRPIKNIEPEERNDGK